MSSNPIPYRNEGNKADSKGPSPNQSSIPPNILIFGETGVGKSSIINMLSEKHIAETSGDLMGQTFENIRYSIPTSMIDDPNNALKFKDIIVWDTAGLNEAEHGKVSPERATENIYNLIGKLKDGLDLLVYVVRGWRLSSVLKTNYEIFVSGLCQDKVPVVLLVTGCENDLPMDNWWSRNESVLREHGLEFKGHACITSTRGKIKDGEYVFQEEYEESVASVRRLIIDNLIASPGPWVADEKQIAETKAWFCEDRSFYLAKQIRGDGQSRSQTHREGRQDNRREKKGDGRVDNRQVHRVLHQLGWLFLWLRFVMIP